MAGEGMKAARKERGLAREEPARVLFSPCVLTNIPRGGMMSIYPHGVYCDGGDLR